MLTKIYPVHNIRKADEYTIKNEPISSVDLMERAARECFIWLAQKAAVNQEFAIFCGPGNNGGDGLVIARLLAHAGYSSSVFILNLNDKYSSDFQVNLKRLEGIENCNIEYLSEKNHEFSEILPQAIIIDAIFGSGLNKELKGFPKSLIKRLNELSNIKVAIDIPSGLFADQHSDAPKAIIFQADYTLSFQFPKLAFMMPENESYVGDWKVLDIHLSQEYISNTETHQFYLTHHFISSLVKSRRRFSHKGSFGHSLIIAGDELKMGAAVLCSKAALRIGSGLTTLHHPSSFKGQITSVIPELMSSIDKSGIAFTKVPELSPFSHIAVGPGLGTRPDTAKALKILIQQSDAPMVLDADALNILSENKTWLSFLPKGSILTPHLGELTRLIGKYKNDFDRLEKSLEFAKKHNIYLLVKGANSMTFTPNSKVFFNSTGNPGMATGGSGDVLTGMIVGLLAQGYSSVEAAILGVYLHGLSGDLAAHKMGEESLIAGDIIDHIGSAYQTLKS